MCVTKSNLEKTTFILNIKDDTEFDFSSWAGILRLYNLVQFSKKSLFVTNKGLEKELYDELEFLPNENKNISSNWQEIYDDIFDNNVKNFIKELSIIDNMQIPSVGEDLMNSDGIIIGEAELFWEEYSIALILDELALEINDIKIFNLQNLNELKNELIERIQ